MIKIIQMEVNNCFYDNWARKVTLSALVVPNSRLLKTTCFNKIRFYGFEYTQKPDL